MDLHFRRLRQDVQSQSDDLDGTRDALDYEQAT